MATTTDWVPSATEINSFTVLGAGRPRSRCWLHLEASPWLVGGHIFLLSSHGLSSEHVCVLISFYKDTSHINLCF